MNKFFASLLSFVLIFGAVPLSSAQKPAGDILDPEQAVDGTYDVPGNPHLKLRVIVHKEKTGAEKDNGKPAKPGSGGGSTLICSLSDDDSSTTTGATGWKLPSAVSYRLNTSNVPASVGPANLATIAANAFAAWNSAGVTLTRGADTFVNRAANDGQNIIAWGTTSGSALAVTYTWYIPSTGEAVATDTIMNQKFAWTWTNQAVTPNCAMSGTYDAQNIMTHEIGHWFGLDDEYDAASFGNNTMYGYGSKGEVKKNTPTTGDLAGINAIYQ